jgi:hypothetical protein
VTLAEEQQCRNQDTRDGNCHPEVISKAVLNASPSGMADAFRQYARPVAG